MSALLPEHCFQLPFEDTLLCWECHALVRRVALFQEQIQRANNLLRSGQSRLYGTLSNLTTVIRTDTEPSSVYLYNTNMTIKEEDEVKEDFNDENIDSPIPECAEICEDKTVNAGKSKSEVSTEKVVSKRKYKNKWAKKRALQNRKPKFKLLNAKEALIDSVFRKTMDIRNSKRNIKCDQCKLEFESETVLMMHFKEKHVNEIACDVCYSLFSEKTDLLLHLEMHETIYNCTLCEFTGKTKTQARNHMNKRHPHIFVCIKCELKFQSRREFFQHYKEWHEKFICNHCGVSFKMRYCIKDHIRKQHSPFVCVPCNKQFARYNGLWLHNKVRHCTLAPPAYCVECDKHYPDLYRYKWHLANSAKHKPRKRVRVPCPDCDKVFSKNIYMKDHHNLIHLKQYNYRCEDCDKNFIRNADLVKHKRRVHDGILPPKNKICYVCGKGFTTNKILSNHLRTHNGAIQQPRDNKT
ncbi:hypothetical protein evm_009317 [Chilo suppressalis]|nr:hypothetical protein evm_009317 [Chilo suppressalis]